MNNYTFENLNDKEFEDLIIRICNELLGIGCKTFSVGKDGAKDSWFNGTAERFPSTSSQWTGNFIIQAKHTATIDSSCSDNDFSVNKTCLLNKEITRLNEIKKKSPFDNYIIFTNRKLSGGAHTTITQKIKTELSIVNAEIIGKEELNKFLNDYPHIAHQFGLYKFQSPLRFYEKDLRDIIIVFSQNSMNVSLEASTFIKTFNVIDKEKKNQLNNLSKDYFEFIKTHSIQYFEGIESFLKNPQNAEFTRMYSNTISDLSAKIILERNRFNDFMELIEHLVDFMIKNNEDKLIDLRRIVRVFIHFMYFNCDIGKTA